MRPSVFAIDPGPRQSAWVLYDSTAQRPAVWAKEPNDEVLERINAFNWIEYQPTTIAIEQILSYGMSVGEEVFTTCVWSGRFAQAAIHQGFPAVSWVPRMEVKIHVCQDSRAKDANIRQALIDRYGGKDEAVGRKATPGPLYGITGDCWSALAVAVTVDDVQRERGAA